jgi:hypothetical protein
MPIKYRKPWIILCEGESDRRFFDLLTKERGLPKFQVCFPGSAIGEPGGRTKFGKYLAGMKVASEFDKIEAVLIVADNDDRPRASFTEVRKQIRLAGDYGVPESPLSVVKAEGFSAVVVMMLPFNGAGPIRGNLESLCLQATSWQPEIRPHLDRFISGTPASSWTPSKRAKAEAHCIIAATCKPNPEVTFAHHWQQPKQYRVPLTDRCFDQIADFLAAFGRILNGVER